MIAWGNLVITTECTSKEVVVPTLLCHHLWITTSRQKKSDVCARESALTRPRRAERRGGHFWVCLFLSYEPVHLWWSLFDGDCPSICSLRFSLCVHVRVCHAQLNAPLLPLISHRAGTGHTAAARSNTCFRRTAVSQRPRVKVTTEDRGVLSESTLVDARSAAVAVQQTYIYKNNDKERK